MRAIVRWMKVPHSFSVELALRLLADHEKVKVASLTFEPDRQAYCAAHVLLRLMIEGSFGLQPFCLQYEASGKPNVFMPDGKQIHVSLSHSHRLAAAALAVECRIGVDVESLDSTVTPDELSPLILSDEERIEWNSLVGREPALEAFLRRWTLKEAIVKATGQGLTANFQSFSVRTMPPLLTTQAPDNTPAEDWQFHADSIDGGYLAVAVHGAAHRKIAFDVEQFTAEERLNPRVLTS